MKRSKPRRRVNQTTISKKSQNKNYSVTVENRGRRRTFCRVCNKKFILPDDASFHFKSSKHLRRLRFLESARKIKRRQKWRTYIRQRQDNFTRDDLVFYTTDLYIEEKLTKLMKCSWKKLKNSNLAAGQSKLKKLDNWSVNMAIYHISVSYSKDSNFSRNSNKIVLSKYYWLDVSFNDPKSLFIRSLHDKMKAFTNLEHCELCQKQLKTSKDAVSHLKTKKHKKKFCEWLKNEISSTKICDTFNVPLHFRGTEILKLCITKQFCFVCFERLHNSTDAYSHYNSSSHETMEKSLWIIRDQSCSEYRQNVLGYRVQVLG